jgi:DNA-binding transcriptional MerR regulator
MDAAPSTDKTFSMDELQALSGVARRTIRYYIELGLLDGPTGETRAAFYTWRHLQQLLEIRRLTEEGLSLERVRQRLAAPVGAPPTPAAPTIEVRSHLRLAAGIELVVEPGAAGLSTEQLRRLLRATLDALARIREETKR